jgi:hypothetical protein
MLQLRFCSWFKSYILRAKRARSNLGFYSLRAENKTLSVVRDVFFRRLGIESGGVDGCCNGRSLFCLVLPCFTWRRGINEKARCLAGLFCYLLEA